MTQVRLYFAIQRLPNLANDANWTDLIAEVKAKGSQFFDNTSHRNHWRPDLNGMIVFENATIVIFEGEFDGAEVDEAIFINWLARTFDVPEENITAVTGYNQYGRFSTIRWNGANYFRIGVFGFVQGEGWPSYQESHAAVLQYLFDNLTSWEPEVEQ